MADLTWPTNLLPMEFELKLFSHVVRRTSMFGRSGQNVNMLNDRWTAALTVDIKSAAQGAELEAFCNSMRNGVNTVLLWHFFRDTPRGTLQGSTVTSSAASQGASTIAVAATTGLTLKAGDYLSVADLLIQVAEDCTSVGGVLTVPSTLRLRKAVGAGATVLLANPSARFRLLPGTVPDLSYAPNSVLQGVNLSFSEAIP